MTDPTTGFVAIIIRIMVDITEKNSTLRIATARATVSVGSQNTIEAIENKTVPKGDVFEMSRAAGLLGIKKTPLILPDCHPLPIEFTGVEYNIDGLNIHIDMTVKTIYKTGVEVEAMHGVSVIALNMYDMLKPIDKNVSINNIHLVSKTGGKSDHKSDLNKSVKLIVCSDSVSKGIGEDTAGSSIQEFLNSKGIENTQKIIINDDISSIQEQINCSKEDLLIFIGGTGIGDRDNTCEVLSSNIDKRLVGVEEQMRRYGQERTPKAMFSRSVAGSKGNQILLGIPGSKNGALESIKSIFPHILHGFKVLEGSLHD